MPTTQSEGYLQCLGGELAALRSAVDDVRHLTMEVDRLHGQMLTCSDITECASLATKTNNFMQLVVNRTRDALHSLHSMYILAEPLSASPALQRTHRALVAYARDEVSDATGAYVAMQMTYLKPFCDTVVRRLKTRYTHGDGSYISDQRAQEIAREVMTLAETTSPAQIGPDPVLIVCRNIVQIDTSVRDLCLATSGALLGCETHDWERDLLCLYENCQEYDGPLDFCHEGYASIAMDRLGHAANIVVCPTSQGPCKIALLQPSSWRCYVVVGLTLTIIMAGIVIVPVYFLVMK